MGLDAVVFCDCVEKKRLKSPHPFPDLLYISPNGSPEIRSRSNTKIEQHDEWMHHACRHEDMIVGGDQLGTISGIEFIRESLARAVPRPDRQFPVLWNKVVYSGAHCGDHLKLSDVVRLQEELQSLRKVDFSGLLLKSDDEKYLKQFQSILTATVKTALRVQKPIAF